MREGPGLTPVHDPRRLDLAHDERREDRCPEAVDRRELSLRDFSLAGHAHSKDAILEVPDAVTQLQEGQRYEERDEAMDEEPAEDEVWRTPQRQVVSPNDDHELTEEGRRICCEGELAEPVL